MGFFSRLFGGSSEPPKAPADISPTKAAVWALAMKDEAAFLQLLSSGAAIDVDDMSEGTPMLCLAIVHGLDRAALALLERKPNVNLTDRQHGMAPLHCAVARGMQPS